MDPLGVRSLGFVNAWCGLSPAAAGPRTGYGRASRGAFGDLSLAESLRSVEPFTREVMPAIAAARQAAE
jgi:hypothetical protein